MEFPAGTPPQEAVIARVAKKRTILFLTLPKYVFIKANP
jgi:hypothetical protein